MMHHNARSKGKSFNTYRRAFWNTEHLFLVRKGDREEGADMTDKELRGRGEPPSTR